MKKIYFCILVLIFFLLVRYFLELQKADTHNYINEEPLAVFSHIEPSEDELKNREGMLKMTYKYGQLLFPKSNLGLYRIRPFYKRVFVEYSAFWPDFELLERNKKYELINRVRILFEIQHSDTAFGDYYISKESFQEKGMMLDIKPTGFNFPGLEGYRIFGKNWYYVAIDPEMITPQGTPLTIACGQGKNISYEDGRCRIHLIFDEDLRAEIRFNMSLLTHWREFYNKLITLINQLRQPPKTQGEIQ